MKIKFTKSRTVQDDEGTEFKSGDVVDVSERSARHWIDRGVAVEYTEPEPTPEPESKVKRAFRTRNRSK